MKNYLIIHPFDDTTDFLERIYCDIPDANKTVVRDNNISKSKVNKLIQSHDRILMLGHGDENGLLTKRCGNYIHIIDEKTVNFLRSKKNLIGVWCFAKNFFKKYNLQGFATGMFISELKEADFYFINASETDIEENNHHFAETLSKCYYMDSKDVYTHLFDTFSYKLYNNKVAKFNCDEFFYQFDTLFTFPRNITILENEYSDTKIRLQSLKNDIISRKIKYIYSCIKDSLSEEKVKAAFATKDTKALEKILNDVYIGNAYIRTLLSKIRHVVSDYDAFDDLYNSKIKIVKIFDNYVFVNFYENDKLLKDYENVFLFQFNIIDYIDYLKNILKNYDE